MNEWINQIKYIVDQNGYRQEVIVPFKTWEAILEDLEYLRKKDEILNGLKHACHEAKLQEECRLPEQCLEDFLNEL